ncbi:hypothetical protein LPJ75_002441, partial [Coemansia sp. RSA 2598]
MSVIDLTFDGEDGASVSTEGLLGTLEGRAAQNVPGDGSAVDEGTGSLVVADSPIATTPTDTAFRMSSTMPGRRHKRRIADRQGAISIPDSHPVDRARGRGLVSSGGVLIELLDSQESDEVEPIGYVTYSRPQARPQVPATAQHPYRDSIGIEHIADDRDEDSDAVSLISGPQTSLFATTRPLYRRPAAASPQAGINGASSSTAAAPRLASLYTNTNGYVAGAMAQPNLLCSHTGPDVHNGYCAVPLGNLYQPPLPPLHVSRSPAPFSSRYATPSLLPRTTEITPAAAAAAALSSPCPADPQSRMSMIGQLKAVVGVSSGSAYFKDDAATQIPTTLINREGGDMESVDVYDNRGRLIGTLEKSVAKTIYMLLAEEEIKVLGMVQGPLKGHFFAPILLSFYVKCHLAPEVNRLLQVSGLYLDQSSTEAQSALRDLSQDVNILTRGMNYVAKDPTRDDSGLLALDANSDMSIPSVFREMDFKVPREGGGRGGGSDFWAKAKTKQNKQALPQNMVVEKVTEPLEDGKTRLANIKSTFVTQLDLPEMDPPTQVRTPLRRHQKQALYFMVHRETPDVDIQSSSEGAASLFPKLWVPTDIGPGTSRATRCEYRHALTNIRCIQRPESVLGGILADDMGLGKTLSVISLILKKPALWKLGSRLKFLDGNSGTDGAA